MIQEFVTPRQLHDERKIALITRSKARRATMNFFKKRGLAAQPPNASAGLPRAGNPLPTSLSGHSQFVKRVSCTRCGAPKTLPSATAYLYCDYCGALIDYDFRIANADTNAGLTNTVIHRLIAAVQVPMAQAKARGDGDTSRQLYREGDSQWVQERPMALSPRAT